MRKKILLLGSGELGKEFVIACQRLGQYVIAVDSYANAPAMQVAHEFEVIDMLNGDELDRIILKHKPDIIVPEIEAIRTERFYDYEKQGIHVVPSAKAANFTMNRKAIRDLAAKDLGIRTAPYRYATSLEELFSLIQAELRRSGFENLVAAGMVLTGGTSKMEGVVELAEEIFHMPVRIGSPQNVRGLTDIINNPIYSTGVGLVLYGMQQLSEGSILSKTTKGNGRSLMEIVKSWFQDSL